MSVRARVTLVAAALTLVVLTAAGVLVVQLQVRSLRDSLDERIEADLAAIAARVEDGVTDPSLGPLGDDDTVAQVVTADGEVVAATDNARGMDALVPYPQRDIAPHGIGHLPSDEARYRLAGTLAAAGDRTVAIYVAATTDDVDESRSVLRSSLLVTVPAVTALLALLTWLLVGRTLRPVEAIRAEVDEIRGGQLHRRVPVPPGADEISRLASTMNAMLDRVDEASRRQQQLVADASHELRSPLTRIRAELEVDHHHPETADLVRTHGSVLEETIALQGLVEDLLHLARHDAGAAPERHDAVDLRAVVDEVVRRRTPARVPIEVEAPAPTVVLGDPVGLGRVVGNLVDNAVRHAASRVDVRVAVVDGAARLEVSDDGAGVPDAARQRIFERFVQLDASRHDGGAGLGLAIVAEVVAHHGGSVAVDAEHRPGACFVVTLPTDRST